MYCTNCVKLHVDNNCHKIAYTTYTIVIIIIQSILFVQLYVSIITLFFLSNLH